MFHHRIRWKARFEEWEPAIWWFLRRQTELRCDLGEGLIGKDVGLADQFRIVVDHIRPHGPGEDAEAMRRILIENARRRKSLKRGGDLSQREVAEGDAMIYLDDIDELLDLDEALIKLATCEPELARLVELRYFAGLSVEEAAEALGVSSRTVKRNWAFARAWLGRELNQNEEN